jgi:predicted nucleic acid-binding protein
MQKVYNLPITVVDRITTVVFNEAARLKSNYKPSLADAIGVAAAKDLSGQRASFLRLPAKPKP